MRPNRKSTDLANRNVVGLFRRTGIKRFEPGTVRKSQAGGPLPNRSAPESPHRAFDREILRRPANRKARAARKTGMRPGCPQRRARNQFPKSISRELEDRRG